MPLSVMTGYYQIMLCLVALVMVCLLQLPNALDLHYRMLTTTSKHLSLILLSSGPILLLPLFMVLVKALASLQVYVAWHTVIFLIFTLNPIIHLSTPVLGNNSILLLTTLGLLMTPPLQPMTSTLFIPFLFLFYCPRLKTVYNNGTIFYRLLVVLLKSPKLSCLLSLGPSTPLVFLFSLTTHHLVSICNPNPISFQSLFPLTPLLSKCLDIISPWTSILLINFTLLLPDVMLEPMLLLEVLLHLVKPGYPISQYGFPLYLTYFLLLTSHRLNVTNSRANLHVSSSRSVGMLPPPTVF